MDRREFISKTALSTAALTIGAPAIHSQPLPDQPNVLFILFDDMNDWIGCLGGHPQARTPNIDALASSGVLFSNAHANATICVPSRASIFSSYRPSSVGIYGNEYLWSDYIDPDIMMPRNFQLNGYSIYRAGKCYHPPDTEIWDNEINLDVQGRPAGFPLNKTSVNSWYTEKLDWGPTQIPIKSTRDHRFANFIINMLDDGGAAPFFHVLGFRVTHDPWYVPEQFYRLFPLESIELPELPDNELDDIPAYAVDNLIEHEPFREIRRNQQWRKAVQSYLAALKLADYEVGRVMNALEDSPYADDTIVVLTSDHSIHLGEKAHWAKHAGWREDSHVPLIWRVPGMQTAGTVNPHATELIDLYPTLIDYCGLTPVPNSEGLSIRPQLEDPGLPFNRPAIVTPRYNIHAIVDDRYRFIRYNETEMELYDHDVDPREHVNIANEPGSQAIIDQLSAWLPSVNVEP